MAPSVECSRPIGILFVCLGNICRSPMAEAVFSHIVTERGLASKFHIDSAGTARYHVGERPDGRTIATCKKHNVVVDHFGQLLVSRHFSEFDYILCMDPDNLSNCKRVKPKGQSRAKHELFGKYSGDEGDRVVTDPYYGDLKDFELMYERIVRCSEGLLKQLLEEEETLLSFASAHTAPTARSSDSTSL
ncbi:Low molecular weight phosphotyrosine protein phosphatase [Coemansia aciculifera]|nr:Low molecular weight phosphotyrosine protein phosphatase [Coemansia aciculifera]